MDQSAICAQCEISGVVGAGDEKLCASKACAWLG